MMYDAVIDNQVRVLSYRIIDGLGNALVFYAIEWDRCYDLAHQCCLFVCFLFIRYNSNVFRVLSSNLFIHANVRITFRSTSLNNARHLIISSLFTSLNQSNIKCHSSPTDDQSLRCRLYPSSILFILRLWILMHDDITFRKIIYRWWHTNIHRSIHRSSFDPLFCLIHQSIIDVNIYTYTYDPILSLKHEHQVQSYQPCLRNGAW